MLHEGAEDLAAALGPVLCAGLDRDDHVVVSCADERTAALSAATGDHPRLRVQPLQEVWRRPATALALCLELAEDATAAGRELVLVRDCEFGSGPVDWSEWARYEAASHAATAGYPLRRFCLLDLGEAPEPVVAAAERLHPVVRRGSTLETSRSYTGPVESVARDGYVAADPLEAGPPVLAVGVAGARDLPAVRHALAAELDRSGLPEWRAYELLLAAGEVTTNALRHGRPPVLVRFWATPERLLCTVTDSGAGFDFPLSSYLAPEPAGRGLGLYLARQVADQMNLRWTPDGFTVRLTLVTGAGP